MLKVARILQVKNLMYGFGDDRNPASDTVNVMEEILIEYITDVVRILVLLLSGYIPLHCSFISVLLLVDRLRSRAFP